MFRKVPQAGIGITKHGVPADRPMGEVPSAPPTPVGIPILPGNSVAFIGEVVADLPRAPPSRLTAEPATLTGGLLAVAPPLAAPTAPAALTGKLRCTTPTGKLRCSFVARFFVQASPWDGWVELTFPSTHSDFYFAGTRLLLGTRAYFHDFLVMWSRPFRR